MTETVTVSAGLEPNEKYRHVQELVQEVPEVAALGRHIISSPYAFHPHLLDISALTISQSLFAQALTVMQNTRLDYATAPYPQSFNWSAILEKLRSLSAAANIHWQSQNFYIVVFLSRIQESTDRLELGKLDERSHAEANKSGGLLKYWFGVPNPEGRNLATCKSSLFDVWLLC